MSDPLFEDVREFFRDVHARGYRLVIHSFDREIRGDEFGMRFTIRGAVIRDQTAVPKQPPMIENMKVIEDKT